MLLSMTGYGRADRSEGGKDYTVEIRALNSKQSDLRLRTSLNLHAYELQLRKMVLAEAVRGKLEMTVEVTDQDATDSAQINLALLGALTDEVIGKLSHHTQYKYPIQAIDGLIPSMLRIPGVVNAGTRELTEEDQGNITATTRDALAALRRYRQQEGEVLAEDLRTSVHAIKNALDEVTPHAAGRIETLRGRMERHLQDYLGRANVDKNRYEQEVLFYLEKMDINEEQVRLAQNCDYFLEVLATDDLSKGRKLAFISQEMGREINTLGAKAYASEIQRLVVGMKEQLEMVKEQLANVA